MRRNISHDAFHRTVARVNNDTLRFGDGRVDAAELPHVDEAFVVDVIDGHRDLVRVRRQHQPRRTAFVQQRDAVSICVGKGLIGVWLDVIAPDALAARLVSGGAGSIDERSQEIQ